MEKIPEPLTQLFLEWKGGDKDAFNELFSIVYDDLRKLARAIALNMGHKGDRTLQTAGILNEVYLKLTKANLQKSNESEQNGTPPSRAQFFKLVGNAIRQIICDDYRKRRGSGEKVGVSLAEGNQSGGENVDLLDLSIALDKLYKLDELQAIIIEQSFFEGATIEEIAERLEIGHSTVERKKQFALVWLRKELS